MFWREEQYMKADRPITLTVAGIVMLTRFVHDSNEFSPMTLIVVGKLIETREVDP
jgi:hypothetical protein